MMKKFLISGGGTGGHIFPALAIAKELERRYPECMLLFVGASDRMEMEKIPAAGYKIQGLWIAGFQRSFSIKTLLFPIKLFFSIIKSIAIVLKFKPDVVIGTGGFVSGPILWVAALLKVPCLIQEQNSYPGITNKLLASKMTSICVAYPKMERFFPKRKLLLTGNPIRPEIEFGVYKKEQALKTFGLESSKKTLLVIGGSLGAKRINEVILEHANWFVENHIQLIWQTGKLYYDRCIVSQQILGENACIAAFISDMGAAFASADLVVSRAGAIAISEICALGKPSILIPSPNVTEDHQKKNALALVERGAALLIEEKNIDSALIKKIEQTINNDSSLSELEKNSKQMSYPYASEKIVTAIDSMLNA